MHSFHNILFVPLVETGEAPDVFADAVVFAERQHARITVFDVVPELSELERRIRFADGRSVTDLARSALTARFLEWTHPFERRVPISVDVALGRRPAQIAAQVRTGHHDLVVIAPDGSPRTRTIARRVMRVCSCPVLIMHTSITTDDVVVAVDPDHDLELNLAILDAARVHAGRHGLDLHVLHAWQPYSEGVLVGSEFAPIGAAEFAAWTSRVEAAHRCALDELLARAGIDDPDRVHLVQGLPVEAITRTAEELGAGLIVIGWTERHGLDALLAGKVAEHLIASTPRSVLVVRCDAASDPDEASSSHPSEEGSTP